MSIFPFISLPDDLEEGNTELPLLRDIAIDFATGNPIVENKTFKIVEGKEALKSWIYKAIKIYRYHYEIYTDAFGSEIMSVLGTGYTKALKEAEVKRYIRESVEFNPYIIEVVKIDSSFSEDILVATIKINSIYGELEVNI